MYLEEIVIIEDFLIVIDRAIIDKKQSVLGTPSPCRGPDIYRI